MSWYVIDAVDKAVERTRRCLFEPFDIIKWLKLALIVFFIGETGNFNGGGNGGSYDSSGETLDFSWVPDGFIHVFDNLSASSEMAIILGLLIFIFAFIIILVLISSIMEFVLVDSLVSNEVRLVEYFRRYLGKGLSLFILRILIFFLTMIAIVIAALPFIFLIEAASDDPSMILVILMVFMLIGVIFLTVVILGAINSFISMAIPVSMYQTSGIFSAFSSVFRQFRNDWKQIVIYWIGRLVLGIIVAVISLILMVIGIIGIGLILLIIDVLLYLILTAILAETTVWLIAVPILIVEFIIIMFAAAFIGMPFTVFMKYHMLSFLEKWYPFQMPMFDEVYDY